MPLQAFTNGILIMKNKNHIGFGMLIGFLAPMLALLVLTLFGRGQIQEDKSFFETLYLLVVADYMSIFIAFAALTNLPAFHYYLNKNAWNTVRGIIFSTLLLAGVVVYLKFIYTSPITNT